MLKSLVLAITTLIYKLYGRKWFLGRVFSRYLPITFSYENNTPWIRENYESPMSVKKKDKFYTFQIFLRIFLNFLREWVLEFIVITRTTFFDQLL